MKRSRRRSIWKFVSWLGLLIAVGMTCLKAVWTDGPPLWWVLRGRTEQRAVIHWDKSSFEITSPTTLKELSNAVRYSGDPLPYSTKCLDFEHPENWSLTLYDQNNRPFKVWLGIDGCGAFYAPSLETTYHGELFNLIQPLAQQHLGTPPETQKMLR